MQTMKTSSTPKSDNPVSQTSVAKSAQSIDDLGSAFEVSERTNPGITEIFIKLFLKTLLTGSKEADKETETALQNLSHV
jgi:hypothetical protein